ncbi:hypothetical protein BH24CHL6_BH24CHL6_05120 [soil metagenome]
MPAQLLERGALLDQLRRELAGARRGQGRLVFVTGEAGMGKTALLQAFRAIFQGLGAKPMTRRVVKLLEEHGARAIPRGPRATTRANPAGRTAREVEILGLISRGLGNAQIAHRLVLSPKRRAIAPSADQLHPQFQRADVHLALDAERDLHSLIGDERALP